LKGVFGARDTPWIKPQPEFTSHVLSRLGAEARSTLMIGDSPFDVQASLNGNLAACWCVTTGTHSADQLFQAGSNRVFSDLWALQEELEKTP
jgi:phosphoglycolate phosphatase